MRLFWVVIGLVIGSVASVGAQRLPFSGDGSKNINSEFSFLSPLSTITYTYNIRVSNSYMDGIQSYSFQEGPLSYDFRYDFFPSGQQYTGSTNIVVSDSCIGNSIAAPQHCNVSFLYYHNNPGKDVGVYTYSYDRYNIYSTNPTPQRVDVILNVTGVSHRYIGACSEQAQGSIIDVDSRSVAEAVPIVGTNLDLVYSSMLSRSSNESFEAIPIGAKFNSQLWNVSVHHYFAADHGSLYSGDGKISRVSSSMPNSSEYEVFSPGGEEIYYFNLSGRHLRTLSYLTGKTIFSFQYDANGNLIGITDRYSNITTFNRDSSGRLTSIVAPKGQSTLLSFDSNNFISSITNGNNESYLITYSGGYISTFTKPGGQLTTFTFDINGKLNKDLGNGGNFWELVENTPNSISKVSQMGRTSTYVKSYEFDKAYLRQDTMPTGSWQTLREDRIGEIAISNPYGEVSKSSIYDPRFSGRKIPGIVKRKINGVERVVTYSMTSDAGSNPFIFSFLNKSATVNGKTTTDNFDKATMTWTLTSPNGATVKKTLDNNENVVSTRVGIDSPTSYTYNSEGKLTSSVDGASNNQMTYSYNSSGFLQSITNALNEVTSYVYDLAGRVTSITLPDLRVVQYGYDSNGNITSVTPPTRPIHNFTFNAFELLNQYQPPALSGVLNVNTTYAYNMDKQLTQITWPSGITAVFGYNSSTGLLSNLTFAGGTGYYYYHPNTDLISRSDSRDNIRSEFTYYGDKIATEEQRWAPNNFLFAKLTYTYDSEHRLSNRALQGYASGSTVNMPITYNNDDKPTQIGEMGLTYTYPSGRLATTVVDTVSDSRTYDTFGNLSGYTASFTPTGGSPTVLYSYTLTRDILHRITTKAETIQGVSSTYVYTYDNVGRLTTVVKDGLPYSSYTYSNNSNRTSGMVGGVSFTATYDNQDRMLTYGSNTYSYGANGHLDEIAYPDMTTQQYSFDALGNLRGIKRRSGQIEYYRVDGKNQTVAMYVDSSLGYRYIFENPYRIAGRFNDSGALSELYFYGSHVSTPEYMYKNLYLHRIIRDHLGSPRLVVRTVDGVVSQRMDYNEFGEVISDSAPGFQPYGFAGGIYYQPSKLVKFGARMYDPSVGRWISKDPILFGGGDPNLYGYVANDPVNWTDPSGLIRDPRDIFDEALNHPNSASGTNGPGNAFQHCFASCMMAGENGSATAAALGAGFEFINNLQGQKGDAYCMDTQNNQAGRDLARENGIGNLTGISDASHKGVSSACAQACSGANSSGRLVNFGGK